MSCPTGDGPLGGREEGSQQPGRAAIRPRVLCVDDEQFAIDALTRVLDEQFEIVTSNNPMDALSILERDGDFAVVVADLNMPQMNGLTFLERVQALSPTTTRLVLTGSIVVDPLAMPPEAVFRMIGKPCAPDLLREIIVDAVSYHALVASSPVQPLGRRLDTPVIWPPELTPEPRMQQPPSGGLRDVARAVADPIAIDSAAPHAILSLPFPARVGLRMTGRTVELLPGLTIVGRSRTCHVPIDDRKVSRRHACFSNDERGFTVRNVSSTNKVLLNGSPIEGQEPHPLQVGDHVTVGSHQLEVCSFGDYMPSLEPTQLLSMLPDAADPDPADEPATLSTLTQVAEKYVRLGQSRDAERILRPLLEGLLRHCESGQVPLLGDAKLAVDWALTIAELNRAGEWVSYVFKLCSALREPTEQAVLERLYRVIPVTPGISMASYRSYVETLVQLRDRLGPAQRFLIRRVQGLETALMMSAHL